MTEDNRYSDDVYPENTLWQSGARQVANNEEFVSLVPAAGGQIRLLSIRMINGHTGAITINIVLASVIIGRIKAGDGVSYAFSLLPHGVIIGGGAQKVIFKNVSGVATQLIWQIAYQDGSKYQKLTG